MTQIYSADSQIPGERYAGQLDAMKMQCVDEYAQFLMYNDNVVTSETLRDLLRILASERIASNDQIRYFLNQIQSGQF